ncbi:MAG TPA: ATP-binding protein [Candidatus Nanoarchaeia archaeon]|nr:ATP-binding protein [Candidatus Nanoarchaeia archaeon]
MEHNKLVEWNPWWSDGKVPDELHGRERSDYTMLVGSVQLKEVTVITGVRRSGKSTLMYQMIKKIINGGVDAAQILFVNLEDSKLHDDSLDDIYTSYRENVNSEKKAYVFFDEIHRKKEWEAWIRSMYDKQTGDKFVISGSSSHLLKKEYSTLLTGRNVTFEVFPLSFSEYLRFKDVFIDLTKMKKGIILEKTKIIIVKALKEYLELGGFPQLLFTPKTYKKTVLAQYFDDILYKDIVDRFNLQPHKTKELALFFMTNVTHPFSLRTLRNSLGLSYDTTRDYVSAFKEVFLFFTLDHFSYSFKEQKTLPQKIFCIDNGLRNAVSFTFSKDEGKLAENMILVELKRREHDVYYWKNKGEVDFIVKHKNNSLTAINVSFTDEINEREIRSLVEFKKDFPRTNELVLITRDTEKNIEGVKLVPTWKWLLEVD